jgi:hypothetical protein
MKVYWLLVLALVACTKRNPAVCCLDEADCKAAELDGIRECAAGLACVEHECVVPSCSMMGCQAATPVCNIKTDVCEGCTDTSHCSQFNDTNVCDIESGACVECADANDCAGTKPICDANRCRACKLDSDCPTGACGDDGACAMENTIVYVHPAGDDSGNCIRSSPCRTLTFAVSRTTAVRNHIVLAPGGYTDRVLVEPHHTPAARLYFHGADAVISLPVQAVETYVLTLYVPATIRGLEFRSSDGSGSLNLFASSNVLERVKVRGGYYGIETGPGAAVLRDVLIEDSGLALRSSPGGHLDVDGLIIGRGGTGIIASGSTIDIKNALIYRTANHAADVTGANGVLSFVTIAYAGAGDGTGPRAVRCSPGVTVRSSILWAPGTGGRAPIDDCTLVSTIAGPVSVAGGMNLDPGFVDANNDDFHLKQSSPARDLVDIGPATDFEGDPRPRGARYDIGADEAP